MKLAIGGIVLMVMVVSGALCGARAADVTGSWKITSTCSYGSYSGKLSIDNSGNITGGYFNGRITGTVRGSSVSMTFQNFLNRSQMVGRVSGSSMSGTYTQSLNSEVCRWVATKVSGPARARTVVPDLGSPYQVSEADEKAGSAAAEAKIRKAQMLLKDRRNCQSLKDAAELIDDASVTYKRIGNRQKNQQLNRISEKITGEGGSYDKCMAQKYGGGKKYSKAATPDKTKKLSAEDAKNLDAWCTKGILTMADMKKAGMDYTSLWEDLRRKGCKF